MLKKIIFLLSIPLLLTITLLFNEFFNHTESILAFKSYVSPQRQITKSMLEGFYSDNEVLKQQAVQQIITTTLENLNYTTWLEHSNYINLVVYKSNILPGKEEELIIGLNLSKDSAVIAIYQPLEDDFAFVKKIENILPIEKIEFLKAPNLDYHFMITHQVLDERLGAFFFERFVEIYLYLNDTFKSVWKKSKYSEEIFSSQWIDSSAPPNEWIKVTENNLITFNENANLQILVSNHRKRFSANSEQIPQPHEFKLQEESKFLEKFYWSQKYQQFIIGEGTIETTNTSIAILTDMECSISSFLGFKGSYYRIITCFGEESFVDKKQVIINKP